MFDEQKKDVSSHFKDADKFVENYVHKNIALELCVKLPFDEKRVLILLYDLHMFQCVLFQNSYSYFH